MITQLAIKVFLARVLDVSLGTVRTIVMVRGRTILTAVISFFEVLIWFLIVKEALAVVDGGIIIGLAYAGGYSTGTIIGGFISKKFISGNLGIQVILSNRDDEIVRKLREAGYAVTLVNGHGLKDDNYILMLQIKNKAYTKILKLIKKLDPKAFIVVQETKLVQNGFFK